MLRHEAILYRNDHEYADVVGSRITAALDAGQPVLATVSVPRADLLRDLLGERHTAVEFVDVEHVGRNPARLIPVATDFAARHPGRAITGVGEPAWPGRTADEAAEVLRHEVLCNVAFAGSANELLCPYDAAQLPAEVLDTVARTHPILNVEGQSRESTSYAGIEEALDIVPPLSPAPAEARTLQFDRTGLPAVRELVLEHAARHLPEWRARSLVLAVSEIASNSIQHAGGGGTLRVWVDGDAVVAEVSDDGRLTDHLAGRRDPGAEHGRGLWLAHQLCDLVQVHPQDSGTVVRLRVGRSG